jgi:integrase/recombinase XerD
MHVDKRGPLNEEEEKKLIDACRSPIEKLLIILPIDTGMRAVEIENIYKKDFMWQHRRISVHGDPKNDDGHIIQLTNRAYDLLSSWFMFCDTVGIKKRFVQRTISTVAKRTGLKNVSFNTLRRTFAIREIKQHKPLHEIMSTLGFRSEEMFKAFINIPLDELSQNNNVQKQSNNSLS